MAGSSIVAGSTAVAGEGVPGLGTITAVLAGVRHTPAITHTHTEAALVAASRLWNQQSLLRKIPVYDGTHVQADVLKRSHEALLHSPEVGKMVVDVDHLHAALEGALRRARAGVQEVSWRERPRTRSLLKQHSQHEYLCSFSSSFPLLFLIINSSTQSFCRL